MTLSDVEQQWITDTLAGTPAEAATAVCIKYAERCFDLVVPSNDRPTMSDFALGATRLGGTPDLPDGLDWPRDDDGKYANFFGQFDLAELAEFAPGIGLPDEGLLSLFTTYIESAAEPVVVRAILSHPDRNLVRHVPPTDDDDFADPYTGFLEPTGVRFAPNVSLPLTQADFLAELQLALEDDDAIYDLREAFATGVEGSIGQLGGFGNPHSDDDFRRILYFHRVGHGGAQFEDYYASDEDRRVAIEVKTEELEDEKNDLVVRRLTNQIEQIRWISENARAIATEARQWRMILRIDSNNAMQLDLMDADPIYFYGPTAEIAAGNFSRIEAMVTQG
ncbi:DUF1963 domain-containing protein [Glaciihabitans sp. dw_435]|uniref:DUF1963 domain-containing protein n=1 Tax=Glaciihabitans sp. dw_435 TaxID=2720081 RepID=UPI001BD6391C|nr:DUF1963 domain-containing protein [Glaciihabitans sp. dw_435]